MVYSDTVWLSHPAIIDDVVRVYQLRETRHINALPCPGLTTDLPPLTQRHIIFAGQPNALYGFDAFCDLAEDINDHLDAVTIILPESRKKNARTAMAKKKLSKLPVKLNWMETPDYDQALADIENGILIAPMRAPVFPNTVREACKKGLPVIWGSGFELTKTADPETSLRHVPSDLRKIRTALFNLWGEPSDSIPRDIPATLPSSALANKTNDQINRVAIKKVSVILIHHDRVNYVGDALAALSRQTEKNFELIIVDDGSSVATYAELVKLAEGFDFPDLKVCTIENSYPSAARNHGVSLATGDAVFFMDDDNVLDPETLHAFRIALNTHDIVLSFFQTFYGENTPQFSNQTAGHIKIFGKAFCFSGLLPGSSLFYNIVGNSSLMIRKDVFYELGGFSNKYGVGLEDYAFLAKAALRGNIKDVVLPEPYLHFRLHNKKIRNTHVDWRSPVRLQAGLWRLMEDVSSECGAISPVALGYARQLHEVISLQYITEERPRFFGLKFIFIHQYVRRNLSKYVWLRRLVVRFTSSESRLAKFLERLIF